MTLNKARTHSWRFASQVFKPLHHSIHLKIESKYCSLLHKKKKKCNLPAEFEFQLRLFQISTLQSNIWLTQRIQFFPHPHNVAYYCVPKYWNFYRLFLQGLFDLLQGFRMRWLYPLQWGKSTPKKECLEYDTKLHLIIRLQFWQSCEYGVRFHCHYSQVYFELKWLYLFCNL